MSCRVFLFVMGIIFCCSKGNAKDPYDLGDFGGMKTSFQAAHFFNLSEKSTNNCLLEHAQRNPSRVAEYLSLTDMVENESLHLLSALSQIILDSNHLSFDEIGEVDTYAFYTNPNHLLNKKRDQFLFSI